MMVNGFPWPRVSSHYSVGGQSVIYHIYQGNGKGVSTCVVPKITNDCHRHATFTLWRIPVGRLFPLWGHRDRWRFGSHENARREDDLWSALSHHFHLNGLDLGRVSGRVRHFRWGSDLIAKDVDGIAEEIDSVDTRAVGLSRSWPNIPPGYTHVVYILL